MHTDPAADGYFTGVDYTPNHFRELSPLRAAFCLLVEGLEPPPRGPCCELGFGQGVSLALNAAGDPDRPWWGTDVMPSHARHAGKLLAAAGVDGVAADQNFAEFCARDDLPRFAFIGLHGVWSWVSEANRALIVDFLRRRLLPGGVMYLSFNTIAGWSTHLPARQLMVEHARLGGGSADGPLAQAEAARAFAQRLLALDGVVAREAPQLRQRLAKDGEFPPEYILHEYMNRDWHLASFAEVAQQLEAAQLSWACATDLLRRLDNIHLKPEHQAFLGEIANPLLRESSRDLMTGQRLRRDLWVRGPRRLSSQEHHALLLAQRVVLSADPGRMAEPIAGAFGEARLPAERVAAIGEVMLAAGGPLTLAELASRVAPRGLPPAETLGLVATLVGTQALSPAQSPEVTARARPATDRLNAALLERSVMRGDMNALASPVTGGGVLVSANLQRVLQARRAAPDRPQDWAELVWQQMQAHGLSMHKDGQAVTDRGAALTLLQPVADEVRQRTLPMLQRLQVVD